MTLPNQPNNIGAVLAADAAAAQTPAPAAPAPAPDQPVPGEGNGQPGIPASVGAAPDASTTPKTAEEVDAFWRNRVSAKDRAHAEAERALREELASLKAAAAAGATSSGGQQGTEGGAATPDPRIEQLQRELAAEKEARLVDSRKAKYPHLAAQVGDADDIFKTSDEAALAKLNALADDSDTGGTFIAPTGPKRAPAAAAKPLHEKSKQELEDDLRRASPAYEEWARSQTRG